MTTDTSQFNVELANLNLAVIWLGEEVAIKVLVLEAVGVRIERRGRDTGRDSTRALPSTRTEPGQSGGVQSQSACSYHESTAGERSGACGYEGDGAGAKALEPGALAALDSDEAVFGKLSASVASADSAITLPARAAKKYRSFGLGHPDGGRPVSGIGFDTARRDAGHARESSIPLWWRTELRDKSKVQFESHFNFALLIADQPDRWLCGTANYFFGNLSVRGPIPSEARVSGQVVHCLPQVKYM
ncbi:hypothetical protein B0H10DRAFT_1964599 [Mycena sp. CBHHK59/15]|nr:hypothetical protein B0H10DRAFT_1964599 [Mycena sp. CBHHK59/15]